jgi:predicted transposase YbfD/YdcC
MKIKRSHWAIENNLHRMLDVAFREDACRASLGNSAENLNILRKEALHEAEYLTV